MRRPAVVFLVGTVLAVALASCGDGGTGPGDDVTISESFDSEGGNISLTGV